MRIKLLTLLVTLLLLNVTAKAQINMADSTVQVISYWDKKEKQNYIITQDKIQIKGDDTVSKLRITYDVELEVLKAEEKSYTIKWSYKNITSNTNDEFTKKLFSLSKDLKVIYKTDELGIFLEVLNWKEIRDFNNKAINVLKSQFSDLKEYNEVLTQILSTYNSKEAIETTSINDIQQFHIFHGGKYKLDDFVEFQSKVSNLYDVVPFDVDINVHLDEIDTAENNYIIRSSQVIDSEQLRASTLKYLTKLANDMKVTPPAENDLKDVMNETSTASRIHSTGWVIYSIQTKTVNVDNTTTIEERVIEIK